MGVFPADHVIAKPARLRSPGARRLSVRRARARSWCWASSRAGRRPATATSNFRKPRTPERWIAIPVRRFREKPDAEYARRYVSGRQLLLERGHVLLEGVGAPRRSARRTCREPPACSLALPRVRQRAIRRKLAEAFPHARTSPSTTPCSNEPVERRRCGHRRRRHRLERRGKLERRLRTAAARRHGNAFRGARPDRRRATGNYVDADEKLVALLGVKDLIVVDTPDALLIADRSRAQEVGELVKRIELAGHEHLL